MNTFDIFKTQIQEMMETDYHSFIQALVSIEIGETNKDKLETLYDSYMENDDVTLVDEFFHRSK